MMIGKLFSMGLTNLHITLPNLKQGTRSRPYFGKYYVNNSQERANFTRANPACG